LDHAIELHQFRMKTIMCFSGVKPSLVHVSNPSSEKLMRFVHAGVHTTHNNIDVFSTCKIIVLCVKPQVSF